MLLKRRRFWQIFISLLSLAHTQTHRDTGCNVLSSCMVNRGSSKWILIWSTGSVKTGRHKGRKCLDEHRTPTQSSCSSVISRLKNLFESQSCVPSLQTEPSLPPVGVLFILLLFIPLVLLITPFSSPTPHPRPNHWPQPQPIVL